MAYRRAGMSYSAQRTGATGRLSSIPSEMGFAYHNAPLRTAQVPEGLPTGRTVPQSIQDIVDYQHGGGTPQDVEFPGHDWSGIDPDGALSPAARTELSQYATAGAWQKTKNRFNIFDNPKEAIPNIAMAIHSPVSKTVFEIGRNVLDQKKLRENLGGFAIPYGGGIPESQWGREHIEKIAGIPVPTGPPHAPVGEIIADDAVDRNMRANFADPLSNVETARQFGVGPTTGDKSASLAGGPSAEYGGVSVDYGGPGGTNIGDSGYGGFGDMSGGSGDTGGCIIVSAATDPLSYEVDIARKFRNDYLDGKTLRGYYVIAEMTVPFMQKYERIRQLVKKVLVDPLISYGEWAYNMKPKQPIAATVITIMFLKACRLAGMMRTSYTRTNGEVF